MRHYFTGYVAPALHAAQEANVGWGFSLSKVRRCACGYETRWPSDFEAHVERKTMLERAMADPTLPLVDFGDDAK